MWNLISTRVTQFTYFDQLLGSPTWKGKKILDFGGNIGTFLVGAGDAVDRDDYWCLDVNRAVIERGRREHPDAHFVHFNRFSSQYNPDGVRHLPIPNCGLRFDIILAFSVFTHTHQREMLDLVGQLCNMLASPGVLAFTFTDPSYDRSLSDPALPPGTGVREMLGREQARRPELDVDGMVRRARLSKWCVLIDDQLFVEPGDEFSQQEREGKPLESYCSYFSVEHMKSLFPEATVHGPVSPDWQHCCVMRK